MLKLKIKFLCTQKQTHPTNTAVFPCSSSKERPPFSQAQLTGMETELKLCHSLLHCTLIASERTQRYFRSSLRKVTFRVERSDDEKNGCVPRIEPRTVDLQHIDNKQYYSNCVRLHLISPHTKS